MSTTHLNQTTSPQSLVAIAVAAHKTGDRELRKVALDELQQTHGIKLSFARTKPSGGGYDR